MGTAILTARKAASVITLGRLQAPADGWWQAIDSEQHAFQAPVQLNAPLVFRVAWLPSLAGYTQTLLKMTYNLC